jgi:hypothetical protein
MVGTAKELVRDADRVGMQDMANASLVEALRVAMNLVMQMWRQCMSSITLSMACSATWSTLTTLSTLGCE